MSLPLRRYTTTLIFFLFDVFWRMFGQFHHLLTGDDLRLRTSVGVSKILTTLAPTPTHTKQLTPTNSNSGLDSDSSALLTSAPTLISGPASAQHVWALLFPGKAFGLCCFRAKRQGFVVLM